MNPDEKLLQLEAEITELKKQIYELANRRLQQSMYLPDSVKSRHIGEGVRFIRSGASTELPTEGEPTSYGSPIFYEIDTKKIKIWDGTTWRYFTLT